MAARHTALITGASRGIGRAIALRLGRDYDVVALGRTAAQLDTLAEEIHKAGGECRTIVADLCDTKKLQAALKGVEAGVLVNNAGVMFKKPFLELTAEEWHNTVDVNFNALFHVTRALLPGMIERKRGHIVNIASIAGRSAFVGGSCYAATKHAVMGFSESLMLEVREHGVRVSVVMPGSVATELFPAGEDTSWMLKPEDVAETVAQILAVPPHALIYQLEVRAALPRR